jgi:hypothetical protein
MREVGPSPSLVDLRYILTSNTTQMDANGEENNDQSAGIAKVSLYFTFHFIGNFIGCLGK